MIEVLIEATAGSREKRSYDEQTLEYKGSGETLLPYPYPYGFILNTRTDEGDGVDCYILTRSSLDGGSRVSCEPIGLLEFFEEDEKDHKVLALLPGETASLDERLRSELEGFIYGIFKRFPEMRVRVGALRPKEEAERFIDNWRVRPS